MTTPMKATIVEALSRSRVETGDYYLARSFNFSVPLEQGVVLRLWENADISIEFRQHELTSIGVSLESTFQDIKVKMVVTVPASSRHYIGSTIDASGFFQFCSDPQLALTLVVSFPSAQSALVTLNVWGLLSEFSGMPPVSAAEAP